MQVGVAFAIKTLADRFGPLQRRLPVVHRRERCSPRTSGSTSCRRASTTSRTTRGRRRNCRSSPTSPAGRRASACTPTSSCCRCTTRCGSPRTPPPSTCCRRPARPRLWHRLGGRGVRRVRASTRRRGGVASGRRWRSSARSLHRRAVHVRGQALHDPRRRSARRPDPGAAAVPAVGRRARLEAAVRDSGRRGLPLPRAARSSGPSTSTGSTEAGIDPHDAQPLDVRQRPLCRHSRAGVGGVPGGLVELAERVPQAHVDRDDRQTAEGVPPLRALRPDAGAAARRRSMTPLLGTPDDILDTLVPMLEHGDVHALLVRLPRRVAAAWTTSWPAIRCGCSPRTVCRCSGPGGVNRRRVEQPTELARRSSGDATVHAVSRRRPPRWRGTARSALRPSDQLRPITPPRTPTVRPLNARSPPDDMPYTPTTAPRCSGRASSWTSVWPIDIVARLATPASTSMSRATA